MDTKTAIMILTGLIIGLYGLFKAIDIVKTIKEKKEKEKMLLSTGFEKEIIITGYERSQGTSEKCKKENNPNGQYDICKFWFADRADIDKPKYTAKGNIGRYFQLSGNNADELIGELEEAEYQLKATIRGSFGKSGELRVNNIDTE